MRREDALVLDMLQAAQQAQEFTEKGRAALDDWVSFYAVQHAVQIIGEAAAQTSAEFRAAHPDLPWSEMIGTRNLIVHGYRDVDPDRLWTTLATCIPQLIPQLEALLP